ncbi:hypothetical protein FOL47_003766 [Perkinsus chesapeaki]|uniref:Uncharacterized protein n=1 Tax=Perkinsus chesapeaki TaxID=330153 RepID=A0A7J6MZJ0_PERCH|nr:hypothetical protein FOL47_003766 [Perkinsus chesapeaki]
MGSVYSFITGGPLIADIDYTDTTTPTTTTSSSNNSNKDSTPKNNITLPADFTTCNTIAVIGGGAMGCAVASWLAILGNTVYLIECSTPPSVVEERVKANLRQAWGICSAVWPDLNLTRDGRPGTKDSCEPEAAAIDASSDTEGSGRNIDDIFGTLEECSGRVHW